MLQDCVVETSQQYTAGEAALYCMKAAWREMPLAHLKCCFTYLIMNLCYMQINKFPTLMSLSFLIIPGEFLPARKKGLWFMKIIDLQIKKIKRWKYIKNNPDILVFSFSKLFFPMNNKMNACTLLAHWWESN